tara:strand:+ start:116 stop:1084 length:969 start_codon:yes stop_codon:yes gene_type:complete
MSKNPTPLIHVLISVFEDRESVVELLRRIDAVTATGMRFRALLIENGSINAPVRPEDLVDLGFECEVLTLNLNLGQQRALAVGLAHLADRDDADVVVIMDGDGEDRPEDIPALVTKVLSGETPITVAGRGRRQDSLIMKTLRGAYRAVFALMTGETLPYGNFSAINGAVLRRLVRMEELWTHYPATLRCSGFPILIIPFDRGNRYAGQSRYNLVSLTVHALRSFVPFAETLLARVLWACGIIVGMGLTAIVVGAVIKVLGYASPGWLTLVAGSVLIVVLQVAAIALITLLLASTGQPRVTTIPATIGRSFVERTDVVPARKR